MNGFTNTVLTLLLGWVRSLLNGVWSLLSSDGGSELMGFLRENWLYLFIALCVGGFLVDRIVYLVRWRPYYVWNAQLERLRQRLGKAPADEYDAAYDESPYDRQPYESPDAEPLYDAPYDEPYDEPYEEQPPYDDAYGAPYAESQPLAYAPPYDAPYAPPPEARSAGGYAQPPTEAAWAQPESTRVYDRPPDEPAPLPQYLNPAQGLEPVFGAPQPEPIDYLRDVQAGFAPQPTPEELYPGPPTDAESETQPALPEPGEPVHPGLDLETFQQNIGLSHEELDAPAQEDSPPVDFPDSTYVRYYDSQAGKPVAKPKTGLSALAQKARSLVGSDDENLSIHDLQPPVDIRQAFHAPVYPKKYNNKGEE